MSTEPIEELVAAAESLAATAYEGWVECPECQGEGGWPPGRARRVSFLRVDQMRMLDHWCETLCNTFGETPYLVGSAITRADFRDVDIRIPLDDEVADRIPLRMRDLNMMLSHWGQRTTGLPIDCQVQRFTDFQAHDGPALPRGMTEQVARHGVN